ncbi:hypothetical protein [Natronomonas marina]|uniref:hypothetical protein n=1 Tax=Natronomonas marina TaxID=2961939 RepID=UPI0020C9C62C|nr:hypothetical protein [Natronomonas marina]
MSASSQSVGRLIPGLKTMAAGVLSFLAVGFVISFFAGVPFIAGFWGGLDQAAAWVILIALVVYIGYYTDDINAGFIFVTLGLLALASLFLPSWATRPFAFVSELLFGTPSLGINRVHFAVLAVTGVILYWGVRARLFGRGKRPAAVTNRIRTNAESLTRQYAKIFAAVGGFLVTSVFLFANRGGEVLGEVFTLASNSPVVGSYLTAIVGYVGAFFTDWPLISQFGVTEFFVVLVALFLIATAAKYSSALD